MRSWYNESRSPSWKCYPSSQPSALQSIQIILCTNWNNTLLKRFPIYLQLFFSPLLIFVSLLVSWLLFPEVCKTFSNLSRQLYTIFMDMHAWGSDDCSINFSVSVLLPRSTILNNFAGNHRPSIHFHSAGWERSINYEQYWYNAGKPSFLWDSEVAPQFSPISQRFAVGSRDEIVFAWIICTSMKLNA